MIYADVSALVPAAGSGTRLGLGPKADLRWGDKTLSRVVCEKLKQAIREIHIGLPASRLDAERSDLSGIADVHAGGDTRFQTLKLLLAHARSEWVLVYDVNRPFTSLALIRRVIEAAQRAGASGAFIDPVVPAASVGQDGKIRSAVARGSYLLPQSPHVYRRDILVRAFEAADKDGIEAQTTFELVSRIGMPIEPVAGEEMNFKITTAQDWEVARLIMQAKRPEDFW